MESNERTDLARLVEEMADNAGISRDDPRWFKQLEQYIENMQEWGYTKSQAYIRAQQERIERLEAVARAADAYLYSYEGTDDLEAALRVWKGESV